MFQWLYTCIKEGIYSQYSRGEVFAHLHAWTLLINMCILYCTVHNVLWDSVCVSMNTLVVFGALYCKLNWSCWVKITASIQRIRKASFACSFVSSKGLNWHSERRDSALIRLAHTFQDSTNQWPANGLSVTRQGLGQVRVARGMP